MKYRSDDRPAGRYVVWLGVLLHGVVLATGAAGDTIDLNDGWRFRPEPRDQAEPLQWQGPDVDDGDWASIDVGRTWESQGYPDLDGAAWYRCAVPVPASWTRAFLVVESVDDGYDLFVNGRLLRSYHDKHWRRRRPTGTRVSGAIHPGQVNLVALRVNDRGDDGGLTGRVLLTDDPRGAGWDPLLLTVEDGWRMHVDPDGEGFTQGWYAPAYDASAWNAVQLDGGGWQEMPGLSDYQGQAWYRVDFPLPDDWRGGRVFIRLPSITGDSAVYVNGRLVSAQGFDHPEDLPRVRQSDGGMDDENMREITSAVEADETNTLVVRVRCREKKRGLRAGIVLAADARALVFDRDWSAVSHLARATDDIVLPGWATGRGVTRTITGVPGSESEAFAAADGSFSPSNRSYSMTVWVYDSATGTLHAAERLPIDALDWHLEDGRYPIPTSTWQAGPVRVTTQLFARQEKFHDRPIDLVYYRCRFENVSDDPARFIAFVAVRPYSITREYYMFARGYNPVYRLSYLPEYDSVCVNDEFGPVSLQPTGAFGAANMVRDGDVSEFARLGVLPRWHMVADYSGLASGAMQFPLELDSHKQTELAFVMPVGGLQVTPDAAAFLRDRDWKKAFDQTRREWKQRFEKGIRIRLPDRAVEEGFYASLAYMLILKDGDGLIPGSFGYNAFWTRDAAYMIDAMLRAGLIDVARAATELWCGFQKDNGQFPSMGPGGPNEWDSQGQAMYSFVQVYRFTGDRQWLARHFDRLLAGARFIREVRRRTMTEENRGTPRWGILPPSVSAEDLGPNDWHFYWDDFWCLRGLKDAAFAARELAREEDAEEIETILNDLRNSTRASIDKVMNTEQIEYIPVAPESASASGRARGTSPAVWPGGVLDPADPLIRRSFDQYWETLIAPRDGGYYHNGQPWPYAGLELAHAYLNLGQRQRAWRMLRWVLDNPSAPGVYAWAEVADGGDKLFIGGDVPHGWACAEYVSLVRDMLVREDGDALLLGSGIPAPWLAHGQVIEVDRARTPFGSAGFRIVSRADEGEIHFQFKGDARPPGGVVWLVPADIGPVRGVEFDGEAAAFPANRRLVIPPAAKEVRLLLDVQPAAVNEEPYRYRMSRWRSELEQGDLYAAPDNRRPMLGVYFYFINADQATNTQRLHSAREAFDFFQINPTGSNVRWCERERMPWIGVDQPAIPLGKDSPQWDSARGVIRSRCRDYGDSFYLLGWNSGSEPHTSFKSPGYTGHSREIYENLGVAEPTRDEFIAWLRDRYRDETPGKDSNADGLTFNADFGTRFENWPDLARPEYRHTDWFEHILIPFRCKLITDCVRGRLDLFHTYDPDHKVTPRLLRSLADPRMSYDLRYLHLGDAAGVTFYCGGGFNRKDPNDTGARVEIRGIEHEGAFRFGLRMRPPYETARGIVEAGFRSLLPETPGKVLFSALVRAEGSADMTARVELLEDGPDGPARILTEIPLTKDFAVVRADLSPWKGRRIRLRLVTDPGATKTDEADRTFWLEPRIKCDLGVWTDFVDHFTSARAGYRLLEADNRMGDYIDLGLHGSQAQVWYADHVISLVANRARVAGGGKRAVANEFHPGSGSPHAMHPMGIYASLIRLMQYRVPSIAYFCHMYHGQFTGYDMSSSEEHVARARNQTVLWDIYPEQDPLRRANIACFMPSRFATVQQADECAKRFGTQGDLVWALGELGADFYLLDDLEQAERYDNIVIFPAYAGPEAEQALARFLDGDLDGRKVLILTSVSRLWAPVGRRLSPEMNACLADRLPASPAGSRLVRRSATLPGGIEASMVVADRVRRGDRSDCSPLEADDGSLIGTVSDRVLCLAGFPETPPGKAVHRSWRDTALRRLVHSWFGVAPGVIDSGGIRIITVDCRAERPGVYSIENDAVLTIGDGLAAYDVLHQHPLAGRASGPAVVRVWPADQRRLIDTDVLEPLEFNQGQTGITATLLSPASLHVSRPSRVTVYWPEAKPTIRVDDALQSPEVLPGGFYRIPAPPAGTHTLEVGTPR